MVAGAGDAVFLPLGDLDPEDRFPLPADALVSHAELVSARRVERRGSVLLTGQEWFDRWQRHRESALLILESRNLEARSEAWLQRQIASAIPYRDVRYVLEQWILPKGVAENPGRGVHRDLTPQQAFWLAVVLLLKKSGNKVPLPADLARRAEHVINDHEPQPDWPVLTREMTALRESQLRVLRNPDAVHAADDPHRGAGRILNPDDGEVVASPRYWAAFH